MSDQPATAAAEAAPLNVSPSDQAVMVRPSDQLTEGQTVYILYRGELFLVVGASLPG